MINSVILLAQFTWKISKFALLNLVAFFKRTNLLEQIVMKGVLFHFMLLKNHLILPHPAHLHLTPFQVFFGFFFSLVCLLDSPFQPLIPFNQIFNACFFGLSTLSCLFCYHACLQDGLFKFCDFTFCLLFSLFVILGHFCDLAQLSFNICQLFGQVILQKWNLGQFVNSDLQMLSLVCIFTPQTIMSLLEISVLLH